MPPLSSLLTPDETAFAPYAGEFGRRAGRFQAAAERPMLQRTADTGVFRGGAIRGADVAAVGGRQEARAAGLAGLAGDALGWQLTEEQIARARFYAERDAARRAAAANIARALSGAGEAGGMGLSFLLDRLRGNWLRPPLLTPGASQADIWGAGSDVVPERPPAQVWR